MTRMVRLAMMLAVVAASPAWAQAYATRLTAVAYDGAMRANVQGDGRASATLDGKTLTVTGTFTALPSPATSASLYSGTGIGIPGPAYSRHSRSHPASGRRRPARSSHCRK